MKYLVLEYYENGVHVYMRKGIFSMTLFLNTKSDYCFEVNEDIKHDENCDYFLSENDKKVLTEEFNRIISKY